jgi:hypothetical protein
LPFTTVTRRVLMAKKHIVGTITGVFNGALDGMAARLVRRRWLGYTVELLESRNTFQKGDIVHLSPAEFLMSDERTEDVPFRDIP